MEEIPKVQPTPVPKAQPSPFDYISRMIKGEPEDQEFTTPKTVFYETLSCIINKQHLNLRAIKDFLKQLNDERNCMINIDNAMRHLSDVEFFICEPKNLYNFDPERRGYVITGRVVSVYKRLKKNKNQLLEDREARDQLTTELERAVFKLYTQGKYPLQKWEKRHTIEDILLQYDLPSNNLQPVLVSNEVFPPFVPIQPSIIMTFPEKTYGKPENIEFLRSSMLHIYLDYAVLISRISSKVIMRKNTVLKGINFIEEGEVVVTSGRVVARGWVTGGVCRNSGFGWKFKPMSFVRFIAKNQNVWKQYLNDIKNNGQYPFDGNVVLALAEQEQEQQYSLPFKGYTRKNKIKLPKLTNHTTQLSQSFDHGKYVQIEKLRHYDDKLNDMFYYKQDLLMRKMKGRPHKEFEPLIQNADIEAAKKARLKRQLSKQRKKFEVIKRNGDQNILIMSVLKRLESLAAEEQESPERSRRGSLGRLSSKPSISRVTPLQLYENRKKAQNRRYYKI